MTPHLAAGLDGVGMLDAGKALGHRFQLLKPFDVFLQRFAAGAGSGGADGVGGGDQHRVDMVDRHVVVMADDGVQDFLAGFAVALGQLGADLGMAALPSRGRPPCRCRAADRSGGPACRSSPVRRPSCRTGTPPPGCAAARFDCSWCGT